ncbi:MAG: GNAT family N-acetyltransferase, partial [Caldicoprobacterales bacterium]
AKDFRGQGIGKQCLSYMEDICRTHGLNRIWLTVNKYNDNSIKAYERFGFKKIEELVQDIGNGFVMDDYKMEKRLEY